MIKKYRTKRGNIFTFNVNPDGTGMCKENKLRVSRFYDHGFQFCNGSFIEAEELPITEQKADPMLYGYTMWGGELRDALPNGRRYYMNGRRQFK
jgi:hypothetical protein